MFGVRSLQHVHTCLLKQSSSAKKTTSPAAAAVTPAPRTPANDKRYEGSGGSCYGNRARSDVDETRPSALGQERRERQGRTDTDTDARGSPRSTRVSLQGVFSPKVGSDEFVFFGESVCSLYGISASHLKPDFVYVGFAYYCGNISYAIIVARFLL